MTNYEVNFDGIVGPTYNFAGLSYGNLASFENAQMESNPKAAALQGLEKMHLFMKLGIKQAVLPPHERPNILYLRSLGFTGNPKEVLESVWKRHPEALIASGSAAAMWTANAATIAPSPDTMDGKLHITPANLATKFHRAHEAPMTEYLLRRIFSNETCFTIHSPLPNKEKLSDEGAANHTRFCSANEKPGIHLFVFGKYATKETLYAPKEYPARQTFEASQAVSIQNQLRQDSLIFAQQHPDAIDAGAFHNDVVSVGNENLFFCHEKAFLNQQKVLDELQEKMNGTSIIIQVAENELILKDAISTYLFNSQIVTLPNQKMVLVSPTECQEMDAAKWVIERILKDPANPIDQVHFIDLKQSMRNGGGPACLRLRIVMTEKEMKAAHQGIFLNDALYKQLKKWIQKHYRDRLKPRDLGDPKLLDETQAALDELTKILQLKRLYSFQKGG